MDLKTLVCKVLGVTCSVSAGLPVGKEGPMVHSGSIVASTVSSRRTRNDRQKRDFVACGAAAGVCTAFSAPIGGILFALEEGTSYWSPSLTWRTFFCSMIALTTLYILNSIGSAFGKVGYNKLFSFGNFVFEEGGQSSFAVFELFLFILVGVFGGLIGAVFNDTNERITHWRMKRVNFSKQKRFVEVMLVSVLVSLVSFLLPLFWGKCTPIPTDENFTESQLQLLEDLVPFRCVAGEEYNEVASLIFTDPGDAIRQLFHLHKHAFSSAALILFFVSYISLAVLTYGIAVPSGLFVPSLLSGAAFGRLFGNVAHKIYPSLAFSNTYALIGAAAVLGGMARMTISLTVILLECTGNEQFVLPLMLTLMTARIVGSLWNEDLYHIHIHLKKGVKFLESELRSITRHHKYVRLRGIRSLGENVSFSLVRLLYFSLVAGQIMGENVIFVRPVDRVGVIYDILTSCKHTNFPVVDTDDNGILYGTIGRNALVILLQQRAFGHPRKESDMDHDDDFSANYLRVESDDIKYFPLVQWDVVEKSYPKYPSEKSLRISRAERDFLVDLRPYANRAPLTVQESSTVSVSFFTLLCFLSCWAQPTLTFSGCNLFYIIQRTYQLFRSIGLRFLPVVNPHNQCVGTITRSDLTPEALADTMLKKGKKR